MINAAAVAVHIVEEILENGLFGGKIFIFEFFPTSF